MPGPLAFHRRPGPLLAAVALVLAGCGSRSAPPTGQAMLEVQVAPLWIAHRAEFAGTHADEVRDAPMCIVRDEIAGSSWGISPGGEGTFHVAIDAQSRLRVAIDALPHGDGQVQLVLSMPVLPGSAHTVSLGDDGGIQVDQAEVLPMPTAAAAAPSPADATAAAVTGPAVVATWEAAPADVAPPPSPPRDLTDATRFQVATQPGIREVDFSLTSGTPRGDVKLTHETGIQGMFGYQSGSARHFAPIWGLDMIGGFSAGRAGGSDPGVLAVSSVQEWHFGVEADAGAAWRPSRRFLVELTPFAGLALGKMQLTPVSGNVAVIGDLYWEYGLRLGGYATSGETQFGATVGYEAWWAETQSSILDDGYGNHEEIIAETHNRGLVFSGVIGF